MRVRRFSVHDYHCVQEDLDEDGDWYFSVRRKSDGVRIRVTMAFAEAVFNRHLLLTTTFTIEKEKRIKAMFSEKSI